MKDSDSPIPGSSALMGWLRCKLASAEQALSSREAMANAQPISEEEWQELAKMPGVLMTKGSRLSKAALKYLAEEPHRHRRIAAKCRHEVEMFRATIDALIAAETDRLHRKKHIDPMPLMTCDECGGRQTFSSRFLNAAGGAEGFCDGCHRQTTWHHSPNYH